MERPPTYAELIAAGMSPKEARKFLREEPVPIIAATMKGRERIARIVREEGEKMRCSQEVIKRATEKFWKWAQDEAVRIKMTPDGLIGLISEEDLRFESRGILRKS